MIPKRDQNPTPLLREVPLYMPRLTPSEEVQVLRFFEQAPYDKAETMLHIVCDKMRVRKPVPRGTLARVVLGARAEDGWRKCYCSSLN